LNSDYQRIAKAISFLQRNAMNQPSLDDVASAVGLSPYHFQRLFRRWAGITPKRFLQFLTVDHAKRLLVNSSILETSMDVGLSSPSRLYDHFIALEAMTPGEYKLAAQGLEIYYGMYPSPFGNAFIAATESGVCQLSFIDDQNPKETLNTLTKKWPKAELVKRPDRIDSLGTEIFNTETDSKANFVLTVQGSNFQIKVWEFLLTISPGSLCSYGQVAAAIGRPSASRAVANAIGANPIAYLIPCHRVIRSTGVLGGYRWGIERKQALLAWESAEKDSAEIF
jgi:AraC family transcriptional regulator of adaptative response/methylated-DNA-[protein]-cysteine methyltransferase